MTDQGAVPAVAVIADLVGSRLLPDRASAQEQVLHAWAEAHGQVCGSASSHADGQAGTDETSAGTAGDQPPAPGAGQVPPWATVGDEFQAVYPDLPTALRALLRVMLALQEPVRLRFGIGLGHVTALADGQGGPIQDGDAWWSARAAIEAGHERDATAATLEVRSAAGDATEDGEAVPGLEAAAARLLEHLIGAMKPRERRIVRATLDGVYQKDVAEAEGISQSAVSQSLTRSGGRMLVDVDHLLAQAAGRPTRTGQEHR